MIKKVSEWINILDNDGSDGRFVLCTLSLRRCVQKDWHVQSGPGIKGTMRHEQREVFVGFYFLIGGSIWGKGHLTDRGQRLNLHPWLAVILRAENSWHPGLVERSRLQNCVRQLHVSWQCFWYLDSAWRVGCGQWWPPVRRDRHLCQTNTVLTVRTAACS